MAEIDSLSVFINIIFLHLVSITVMKFKEINEQ